MLEGLLSNYLIQFTEQFIGRPIEEESQATNKQTSTRLY